MSKTALILHGWPQTSMNEHFLVQHLKKKNYKIITPNLFETEASWSLVKVYEKINKGIKGDTPDAIVGISLGGLILPSLALHFKESKLIFIATAPSFKPNIRVMRVAKFLFNRKLVKNALVKLFNRLSKHDMEKIYRMVNPFRGDPKNKKMYDLDLKLNIEAIQKYPILRHIEILDNIVTIDNSNLLSHLENKSIIFAGKNDTLMPVKEVRKLNKLLKHSEYYVNKGSHFNVFTKKDLPIIDKFLS